MLIEERGLGKKLKWTVDIETLNYGHILPIFFAGIQEKQDPYRFVAFEGDILSEILPINSVCRRFRTVGVGSLLKSRSRADITSNCQSNEASSKYSRSRDRVCYPEGIYR